MIRTMMPLGLLAASDAPAEAGDSWLDALRAALEPGFVPFVRWLLAPIHATLASAPESAWRVAACSLLLAGSLWTLALGKEGVFRGAPGESRWCDLRIWAVAMIVPYLVIYALA